MDVIPYTESALDHGVAPEDMTHAVRRYIDIFDESDERGQFDMFVGPARDGALLEVGVVESHEDGSDLIVHAMPVRWKYLHELGF